MSDSPNDQPAHGEPPADRTPADEPSADQAPADGPLSDRPPYVLPLVVRIERATPPARTDALETAARAVLTFLSDPRTAEETGEWHKRVQLWEERGIRKVVRRARGSEWRRAEPLPGLTVTDRTAEVRVFPPVPVDSWPKDLARLQVGGTDLTDPEPPPEPPEGTAVLWLSPELEMTAGKAMAQAAHGAQLAWWELGTADREAWGAADFPLAVRTARDAAHWRELTTSGLPVVRDAGFTEIPADSCTVVADHPALRSGPGAEPQIDL